MDKVLLYRIRELSREARKIDAAILKERDKVKSISGKNKYTKLSDVFCNFLDNLDDC